MELIKLMKLMAKEKKQVLLAFLFGFLAAVSSVGLMGAGGYLISMAALEPPLYTLTLTIVAVRAFGLIRAGSRYGERYISHKATFTILGRLRMYVYDRIEPMVPKIFGRFRSGDLLSRVVSDVDRLQFFFLRVVYPPMVMLVVFLLTSIFLLTFSVWLTVALWLGFIIASLIIPFLFSKLLKKAAPYLRDKNGELSNQATDILFGYTELKTNLQLDSKCEETDKASRKLIQSQEKNHLIQLKGETTSFIVSLFISWTVLFIGVVLVDQGSLNGVFLAMIVLGTITVFETATPMASLPSQMNESHEAGKRLFSITDTKTDEKEKQNSTYQLEESDEQPGEGSIDSIGKFTFPPPLVFKGVSFTYPNSERTALENINFSVSPGEKVAIVGASGSGKSTILQLLLQFYTDYQGSITIGNKELKTIIDEENRKHFSVVMQENHFFHDTVKRNLLIANSSATEEELNSALQHVSLQSLTLKNMLVEKGANISGGERQRLAIARMLLKDAPILLLDELTTGIDAITERDILSILWPHVKGKSLIFITHRLRDLEKMDKILVMDRGRIIEQGSYEELMINYNGHFYRLKRLEEELVL